MRKKHIYCKMSGCQVQCFKNYNINLKLAPPPKKISKSPNVGNFDRLLSSRRSRVTMVLVTSTAQSQAMMESSVYFFDDGIQKHNVRLNCRCCTA
jgi:hypothetical protein